MPPPDNATLVSVVDELSEAEREEADTLTQQLTEILVNNDMADKVALLYSPLVDLVLAGNPPAELLAMTDDVHRLDELRQIPGARFGLYEYPAGR